MRKAPIPFGRIKSDPIEILRSSAGVTLNVETAGDTPLTEAVIVTLPTFSALTVPFGCELLYANAIEESELSQVTTSVTSRLISSSKSAHALYL